MRQHVSPSRAVRGRVRGGARPAPLGRVPSPKTGVRGEDRAGAEHPAGARAFPANEVQHFIINPFTNPFTLRDGRKCRASSGRAGAALRDGPSGLLSASGRKRRLKGRMPLGLRRPGRSSRRASGLVVAMDNPVGLLRESGTCNSRRREKRAPPQCERSFGWV